jgi:hypothetical protein
MVTTVQPRLSLGLGAVRRSAGNARRLPHPRHRHRSQRLRSFLTLLGIAVGIAAVILLTSIGEGIHRYVLAEFTQFGTNVIGVHPGKTKTGGAHCPACRAARGRCRWTTPRR